MSDIPEIPFVEWPKIARYNKPITISEKIDGTNAQVYIDDLGENVFAGSRTRWITPESDNFGFARWVQANKTELLRLGPGSHFGEWWGAGIQRTYGLKEKRFSLFNTGRWTEGETLPTCCSVVPVLAHGPVSEVDVLTVLKSLKDNGSSAVPGFMNPEGIVIYHSASRTCYKMTLDANDNHKWAA